MNMTVTQTTTRSAVLSYFSLFSSLGTLLCCALPSLLVLFGLGASVASLISYLPWLATLSRHKQWTFLIAGSLIALSFLNIYYVAPHLRAQQCGLGDPSCDEAGRLSKILLWVSAAIYGVGFFVAYALGPILARVDSIAP